MKTSRDPRHIKRIRVMQDLFAWDFNRQPELETTEAAEIIGQIERIDQLITGAAPAWPISKINKIDLAVLRQAVFELMSPSNSTLEKPGEVYDSIKVVPPKVVVDEAVEIAKEFGGPSSPSFVNGVLGKIIELHHIRP